jgi:transketolase
MGRADAKRCLPEQESTMSLHNDLTRKAAEIRLAVLKTALKAGKGHVPPAFSWVEIAVALYCGGVLRVRPSEPHWPERDRFILSKGHGCLTLYAMLADRGFIPAAELDRFAGDGSLLPGHPDFLIPGVDGLSGSLGHGLGTAAGMALAARIDGAPWRVFTVLGDGECNEGSIWEAAMFAGHRKLSNLVAIIDRNGLSATDYTENVIALEPLADRWAAFGWDCVELDGHSLEALLDVLSPAALEGRTRPLAIIARTVKGKGVDFMLNSPNWHHQMPKGAQIEAALSQLRAAVEASAA